MAETKAAAPAVETGGLLDDWMSRAELAWELDVSQDTLARWECRRIGPVCVRVGRRVLYRRAAVKDWLLEQESPQPRGRKRK